MKKILLIGAALLVSNWFLCQDKTEETPQPRGQYASHLNAVNLATSEINAIIIYPGCEGKNSKKGYQNCLREMFTKDVEETAENMGYDLGCKPITATLRLGVSKTGNDEKLITIIPGDLSEEQESSLQKTFDALKSKLSTAEDNISLSLENNPNFEYVNQFAFFLRGTPDYILDSFTVNDKTYNAYDVCGKILLKEHNQLKIIDRFDSEDSYYSFKTEMQNAPSDLDEQVSQNIDSSMSNSTEDVNAAAAAVIEAADSAAENVEPKADPELNER